MGQVSSKYNLQCTLDSCLDQVVGNVDNNGPNQYEACSSMFGLPTATFISTITLPGVGYTYTTTTVPYTDIVVERSTATSTAQETSTSTIQVDETTTIITATNVATSSVVANARAGPYRKNRRDGPSRRSCKPSPISTTAPPPFPIASSCPSLEKYSSACSCIYAASDATTTITTYVPASTSTYTRTDISTVETSTSTEVEISTVTSIAIELSSFTSTATIRTATDTTITVIAGPTQSAYLRTVPGNKLLAINSKRLQFAADTSASDIKFQIDPLTGFVSPAGQSGTIMRQESGGGLFRSLVFYAPGDDLGTSLPVTCRPDAAGAITCRSTDPLFYSMWDCTTLPFLAQPDYAQLASMLGCTSISSLRWSSE